MIRDNQLQVGWDDDDNELYEMLPEVRCCPRCGKDARWDDDDETIMVVCPACGYYNTTEFFESPQALADWWNDRPLEDALRAQLAAAQADADPDTSDYYTPTVVVTNMLHEIETLRAQLAETWTPVEDGFARSAATFGGRHIERVNVTDDWLTVAWRPESGDEYKASMQMPPDLRLCRRVPGEVQP